jgi:hypothetical protein
VAWVGVPELVVTRIPVEVREIVRRYRFEEQCPVRFRPSSWEQALASADPGVLDLLSDPGYTCPRPASWKKGRPDDRVVTRKQVRMACSAMDLTDPISVFAAFVLVMAWGSGTTGNRGLRNTRIALDSSEALDVLTETAQLLRESQHLLDGGTYRAHRAFRLPGIGQAFFTKWFTSAGVQDGRDWQPLILDSLVYTTLNKTVGVTTRDLAGTRDRAHRYVAYVGTVHTWADQVRRAGQDINSERLEWMMFEDARRMRPRSALPASP